MRTLTTRGVFGRLALFAITWVAGASALIELVRIFLR